MRRTLFVSALVVLAACGSTEDSTADESGEGGGGGIAAGGSGGEGGAGGAGGVEEPAGPCTEDPEAEACTSCLSRSVADCNAGACKTEADVVAYCDADCATVYGRDTEEYRECYDSYCLDDVDSLHVCWFQKCPGVKACY